MVYEFFTVPQVDSAARVSLFLPRN